MRVLYVHCAVAGRGGEEAALSESIVAVQRLGVETALCLLDNDRVRKSALRRFEAGITWSSGGKLSIRREVESAVRDFQPDVVHCHNVFPQLGYGIWARIRECGAPVVQTWHNFRPMCLNGLLLRDGHICTRCMEVSSQVPGLVWKCYNESRLDSAMVALGNWVGRKTGSFDAVDQHIVLSEYARNTYRRFLGSYSRLKIVRNTVNLDSTGKPTRKRSGFLYVGRIASEKGILELATKWREEYGRLTVIGYGDRSGVAKLEKELPPGSRFLGRMDRDQVLEAMGGATALIVPSRCAENCPMVIVEAFAMGLPVIARDLGAMREMIRDGVTGCLVGRRELSGLADAVRRIRQDQLRLTERVRAEFDRIYAPHVHGRRLVSVYGDAVNQL